jgi:hypothetical protein
MNPRLLVLHQISSETMGCGSDVTDLITELASRQARLASLWCWGSTSAILLPQFIVLIIYLKERINKNSSDNSEAEQEVGYQISQISSGTFPLLLTTYIWSGIVFLGIIYYGYQNIMLPGSDLNGVIASLVIFANNCIVCMFLLAAMDITLIPNDKNGTFNCIVILTFSTNFLCLTFSVIFALILRHTSRKDEITFVDVEPAEYSVHIPESVEKNYI